MNFDAAFEVYIGNLDAAETLAQGIKDGCQTAVKFGLKFVNPTAAEVADVIYDAVDFGLEYRLGDQEQAVKDLVLKRAVKEVFNYVEFEELGGKTISDWVKNRTGKYLFPTLSKLIESEECQWALSKVIKEGVANITEFEVRNAVTSIIDEAKSMVNYGETKLKSPGELRVYDSQGRVTGLVKGEVKSEIPKSVYDNGTVTIFFLTDSYRYEVAGTDEGTYELEITSVENGETTAFTATDIPTTSGATHQYTIDWDALSKGEKGVTMQIDSDGDGTFESTVYLSREGEGEEGIPLELISGIIVIVALIGLVLVVVRRGRADNNWYR